MKNIIYRMLALNLMLVIAGATFAQNANVFVFHKGGAEILYVPVAHVDSLVLAQRNINNDDTIPDTPDHGNDTIPTPPEPKGDYEMVDLGLSVMWATCNVGATKPGETGSYFRWSETIPTSIENGETRSLINLDSVPIRISGTKYDAAFAERDGLWHTPTIEELQELTDKCQWEWSYTDGHYGMKVTGPNGNSIFLPAAGWVRNYEIAGEKNRLVDLDLIGNYMNGNDGTTSISPYLEFDDVKGTILAYDYSNVGSSVDIGMSVRPVYGQLSGKLTPRAERQELIDFRSAYNKNEPWKHSDNWFTPLLPETWYGLTLDKNGSVVSINLDDNNLYGYIDISEMPNLRRISVNNNPKLSNLALCNTQVDSLIIDNCFNPDYWSSPGVGIDSIHYLSLSNYGTILCLDPYYDGSGTNKGIYDNVVLNKGVLKSGVFSVNARINNLTFNEVTFKNDFKPGTLKTLTLNNSTIEQYPASADTDWQAIVTDRFECRNSTVDAIVRQTDFPDGCLMIFENAKVRISRNTVKTLNCTFTQSTENWIKYVVEQ